jgi:hypothetical protein
MLAALDELLGLPRNPKCGSFRSKVLHKIRERISRDQSLFNVSKDMVRLCCMVCQNPRAGPNRPTSAGCSLESGHFHLGPD